MFGVSIIFFIKALLFGVATIVAIPREVYKKYFIYGFAFGALGDTLLVVVFKPLHLLRYLNMGPFDVWGLFSYWTPIAWMFAFMLFLYFLPTHKVFFGLHIIGFTIFAYSTGLVLQNLGLFQYIGKYLYFAPITFLIWFSLTAWAYTKLEKIQLK